MNSELESANPAAVGRISEEPHPAGPQEVTQLLANWSHGDHAALEKLIPLVYELEGYSCLHSPLSLGCDRL